ncbi:MAG: relaxase/mobilization nuclease domain-containing protein [Bacteroidaceae bacterium]|nr:relaxase/mobilization nuclease domain-containing protein [Bacteroidaceae bacterium]
MIAKIHTGNNFGGLINYANDIVKKDAVVVASYGVSLASNAAIAASFKAQAKARPGVKNFVGHISLSFSPDDKDKMSDDLMAHIAKEYMQRMGIINTQFVVFRHQDQPHPHVHIVYNRVNNDGDAINGDCNFRKSAAITKALTREYGLTFGKGKKNVRRERLKGKDVIKYRLYDEVTASLKDCHSWQELRNTLSVKGISLDFTRGSDCSVRGVTFTDDEHQVTFAGGKIDHSLSFDSIENQMGNTNGLGAAVAEMLLQPHVVPSSGGGGGSSSKDDDDDKDRDKKHNYIPRKRRR